MLDASQSKHKTFADWNREFGIDLMFSTQIIWIRHILMMAMFEFQVATWIFFSNQNFWSKIADWTKGQHLSVVWNFGFGGLMQQVFLQIQTLHYCSMVFPGRQRLGSKFRKECSGGAMKMWFHQVLATYATAKLARWVFQSKNTMQHTT